MNTMSLFRITAVEGHGKTNVEEEMTSICHPEIDHMEVKWRAMSIENPISMDPLALACLR